MISELSLDHVGHLPFLQSKRRLVKLGDHHPGREFPKRPLRRFPGRTGRFLLRQRSEIRALFQLSKKRFGFGQGFRIGFRRGRLVVLLPRRNVRTNQNMGRRHLFRNLEVLLILPIEFLHIGIRHFALRLDLLFQILRKCRGLLGHRIGGDLLLIGINRLVLEFELAFQNLHLVLRELFEHLVEFILDKFRRGLVAVLLRQRKHDLAIHHSVHQILHQRLQLLCGKLGKRAFRNLGGKLFHELLFGDLHPFSFRENLGQERKGFGKRLLGSGLRCRLNRLVRSRSLGSFFRRGSLSRRSKGECGNRRRNHQFFRDVHIRKPFCLPVCRRYVSFPSEVQRFSWDSLRGSLLKTLFLSRLFNLSL